MFQRVNSLAVLVAVPISVVQAPIRLVGISASCTILGMCSDLERGREGREGREEGREVLSSVNDCTNIGP